MKREVVPEVSLEESRESNVPTRAVPQPRGSCSVVALERIDSVFLWPEVNHIFDCENERIGENSCEI